MDYINGNKYFLSKITHKMNLDWHDQTKLKEYLTSLQNHKTNNKGIFNSTFFLLGVCCSHTFIIYQKKMVLHEFERKAFPHMATCLGIGLASGFIIGAIYGNSAINTRKYNRIEKKLNNRIDELLK